MEQTIQRLARKLGATGIETAGHDTRFVIEGGQGGRMQVSVEGAQQRLMAVLKDAQGIVRCTLDLAPIRAVTEDKAFPHRVTLHVGSLLVHMDSEPTLAVEVVSAADQKR
jgi:hypothetical protein